VRQGGAPFVLHKQPTQRKGGSIASQAALYKMRANWQRREEKRRLVHFTTLHEAMREIGKVRILTTET
jgi:hypothetical protein